MQRSAALPFRSRANLEAEIVFLRHQLLCCGAGRRLERDWSTCRWRWPIKRQPANARSSRLWILPPARALVCRMTLIAQRASPAKHR